MAIKVEHELHERRRSRNNGVGWVLLGLVGIVFGLTVVKVLNLESIVQFERFDHVARPLIEPGVIEAMSDAQRVQMDAALADLGAVNLEALSAEERADIEARLIANGLMTPDGAFVVEAAQ